MGNKSVRIKTTPGGGDKYLKIKLEQDVDQLEILSLKISQKDLYGSFNADFGVLVGRVIANGGIGIPNAKLSVFIPISDEDKMNPAISALYPYTTPRDLNRSNVRYNLLPRVSVNNPFNTPGELTPTVPVGSFPTKEEITTNETFIEVYEKYYKYTTVTNTSGDYMIYGIPVGNQTIHMSVDVTDIGQFSMSPATMISQLGYSPELFEDGKVKFSTDLDTVPNIDTQNISVDVRPFWGDSENFEIGITRQDFKIRATLVTSVVIFGAGFTDTYNAGWGSNGQLNRMIENPDFDDWREGVRYNLGIASKRNGKFDIDVFYYPNRVSDIDIIAGDVNTQKDIVLLDPQEYSSSIDTDGQFILTLPCNRRKKVINELGQYVDTDSNDPNGIFTEFKGFITIKYGQELGNIFKRSSSENNRIDIIKLKIPQTANIGQSFTFEHDSVSAAKNEIWRKQYHTFEFGKIYSIAKYHSTVLGDSNVVPGSGIPDSNHAFGTVNSSTANPAFNSGSIIGYSAEDAATQMPFNANAQLDTDNVPAGGGDPFVNIFAAEWLNFAFYAPAFRCTGAGITDSSDNLTDYMLNTKDMTCDNTNLIAATEYNTAYFARSDYHKTKFIEVPRADLVNILQNAPTKKGFKSTDSPFDSFPLIGNYQGNGSTKYFFRGAGTVDCIQALVDNGIIKT